VGSKHEFAANVHGADGRKTNGETVRSQQLTAESESDVAEATLQRAAVDNDRF